MLTHNITQHPHYVHVSVQGRIDGMTVPQLDDLFASLITAGSRNICVNLAQVHYISSVGLRVFLKTQKQLSRAAGKLVIQQPSEEVHQVFALSGFDKLFTFISDECDDAFGAEPVTAQSASRLWQEIEIREQNYPAQAGRLEVFGSTQPLQRASYSRDDVIDVPPEKCVWGCGLAALGAEFSEYSAYFGEAMMLHNACVVYPAVAHGAVDMMLGGTAPYHLLNGFCFDGAPQRIALLEHSVGFVTLQQVVQYVQDVSTTDLSGVILMGESKGLWGMNLRKVPLRRNHPDQTPIMDADLFSQWMNFPIEPDDFDQLIIGCGVVKKPGAAVPGELVPQDAEYHLHAGVFRDAILNKTAARFMDEIRSIVMESECTKVQHLLAKTCFSSVMVAIVPLQLGV
jgi:anti-anti-sigma factor